MFEWLSGDPVNGMLMTAAFFIFLIIGRQFKLRQIQKTQNTQVTNQEHSHCDGHFDAKRSCGNSPLHRLDARIKLICAFAAVFAIIALTHLETAIIPIVVCVVLVIYSRAPLKGYLKRLMYPTYVAVVIVVIQMFTIGSHVVATVPVVSLPIYQEGISMGILIFARVLAASSVLNLLITVTTMETLLDSLAWFRVPSVMLDTTMLMYRYISVVSEEKARIYKAQESRCGYTKSVGVFRKLGNYGTVAGMLLVKSFDRAIKVGDAMVSRGYTGTSSLFSYSTKKLEKKDIALCVLVISAVVALVLADLHII